MDYFSLKKLYNSKTKFSKVIKKMQKLSQKQLDFMLLESIANGDLVLFDFLCQFGANVNAANEYGETAVMYACHYNNKQMLEKLIEGGAMLGKSPRFAFSFTMDTLNQAYVTSLYDDGLNYSNKENIRHRCAGVTELMYAAASRFYGDNSATIKLLLEQNKIDVNAKDSDGTTALMYAAESGNFEAAKVLIEYGAEINAQDKNGNTALMIALNRMYSRFMIKLLVINGADTQIKNNFGESVEDMAKRNQKRIGVAWLDQAKHFKEIYKGRPTGLKVIIDENEPER